MRESGTSRVAIETVAGLLAGGGCRRTAGSPSTWARRGSTGATSRWPAPMDTLHLDLALGPLSDPVAVNIGNPHAVFFVPDAEAIDLATLGPAARAPSAVSRARQHRGGDRAVADAHPPARVGARRRHHPGLRHRRLRRPGGGRAARPDRRARPRSCSTAARSTSSGAPTGMCCMTGPVATSFTGALDDRSAGRRMSPPPPGSEGRSCEARSASRMSAGHPHLRLPAQRLRVRGDARRTPATAGLGDAVIVNTCAVTAEAERQARQAIRRARRERPDARIIVTGCAAQIDPAGYAAMPEVDHVLGNAEKLQAESFRRLADGDAARVVVDDIMAVRETAAHLVAGFGEPRARLPPGAAGLRSPLHLLHHPVRPRPQPHACRWARSCEQVRALVEGGTREIVLTGVDITAYGARPAGRPSARPDGAAAAGAGAGAAAAAALLARSGRDRRRARGG